MFDTDQPARILRLDARESPKTVDDVMAELPQHRREAVECRVVELRRSFPAQMDAYLADRWARLHAPDPAISRVRQLRIADGDLAYALDSAL